MSQAKLYEPVIGLEVHAQMLTATKAFCGCPAGFNPEPNSNVCPVCLGMPGALPVLNGRLVEFALRLGIATHCTIATTSVFARKNYFYADLPKGYQISQYEEPICSNGWVDIELDDRERKRIGITRIHMEEDAGKSIHDAGSGTLVDANRCGVPLIEIVSEPDLRSPREAYHYLHVIRQLLMYLDICDGNMEEGSFRCDANISIRRKGERKFGTKTEVKNMNSFRNVERALESEIGRQIELILDGGTVQQETLLWDAERNLSYPMRGKEEAHDYRYFPDPDLAPVHVDDDMVSRVQAALPELPSTRRKRFVDELGLPDYDAGVLTEEKGVADYFESVLAVLSPKGELLVDQAKLVSNWVMTDVLRVVGERKIDIRDFPISPLHLGGMIAMIMTGAVSGKIAKEIFEIMLTSNQHPEVVVRERGLLQISDPGAIEEVVHRVLGDQGAQVQSYLDGNERVFGFFVGEIMKATKGKANPGLVNAILKRVLDGRRE